MKISKYQRRNVNEEWVVTVKTREDGNVDQVVVNTEKKAKAMAARLRIRYAPIVTYRKSRYS